MAIRPAARLEQAEKEPERLVAGRLLGGRAHLESNRDERVSIDVHLRAAADRLATAEAPYPTITCMRADHSLR